MTGSWERICRTGDVPAGRPAGHVVGDSGQDRDRVCVLAHRDLGYVALLDRCPHRDVPLSGGLVRDGALVCPGHFWCFDLRTGARTDGDDRGATIYPTRVVDDWVEALLPPPSRPMSMRERLLAAARAEEPAP